MPSLVGVTAEQSSASFLDFLKNSRKADSFFYANKDIEEEIEGLPDDDKPKARKRKSPQLPSKSPSPTPKNHIKPASRNGLSSYYVQIGRRAPFTREEEETIFRRYNAVKKKLKKLRVVDSESESLEKDLLYLRNKIVEHNLRFVVKVARSFWMGSNTENLENLISAGNIGLIRAVDRFDTKRGTRFLSYAAHWIALEIRTELASAPLVKIPIWWQKMMAKLAQAHAQLAKSMDVVTTDALAKKSSVAMRLVSKLGDGLGKVGEDAFPSTRLEISFSETEHSGSPREEIEGACFLNDARECIEELLADVHQDCLEGDAPTDQPKFTKSDAVRSVFGLTAQGPQNLRQISNVTNVCSERVRQLKEEGLVSLRKKMRNHKRFSKVLSVGDIL